MAVDVDIKALLKSGVHFGHKTSRWQPKMARYIHSKRAGSHIIDLTKTVEALDKVLPLITEAVAGGGQVLLVGTKQQARAIVLQAAQDTGMPYVINRWVGGMLTNKKTINDRIKYLQKLENQMASGELTDKYSKLEVQRYQEEIDEMDRLYGGIKDLRGKPSFVFVTDIVSDKLAVKEAKRVGSKVVGVADTNSDPTTVDYPIPGNDDAIKSIQEIMNYIVKAINDGKAQQKSAKQ